MYAYYIICIRQTRKKHAVPHSPSAPPTCTPAELLRFFLKLLPRRALLRLPALQALTFYERLFTPLVTLWYLLFQWIHHDHTLEAVVTDARAGGARRLHRKLARGLRSVSTGPYSDARRRLPEGFLAEALRLQGSRLRGQSGATLWKGLTVALLDGTTVRLRPHGDIAQAFAPHGNQHQQAYWCLMRVAVTFCGWTGAALDCALGATALSEQALACEIILRTAGHCLLVGDRNFGVFRIVQAARHARQQVLLRLSDPRAAKLLGRPLQAGDFPVTWAPSRHDQLQPACPADPIAGRLLITRLARPGFRPQWLCLFTTLVDPQAYPAPELAELYGRRWHIELDLRYVKAQMGAAQLEVYSAAMARKQWLACLLAYNLVRAAMWCAAMAHQTPPLTLSFSACRRCLEAWLRDFGRTLAAVTGGWPKLLRDLARCTLPKRKKPRPPEPRAKRHVRESFPPLVGSRTTARLKTAMIASKS
ncbi:MAG TPA: IS4 family transposase [Armatimonadota bacterium]|nr:IS4 family transposase [Armatimonadota bacterium]